MRNFKPLLIYFLAFLLITPPLFAAEKDGVSFLDQIPANDGSVLSLNGLGTRKATIFGFKVYVAGLYLTQPSKDPKIILQDNVPERRLVMKFVRDVDREDMAKAWQEGFEKNNSSSEQLHPILMQMLQHTVSVKSGDTVSLTVNQSRVALLFNDREQFTVINPAFGTALLRIWLGESPPNSALKEGLLGIE